jgi:hypothetical protein
MFHPSLHQKMIRKIGEQKIDPARFGVDATAPFSNNPAVTRNGGTHWQP